MPFMSPSACFTAWPSAMPTSSVVWWWSMCRSPLALTVMSMREWRASRSSMWSKKPMPVAIVGRARAVEIDRDLDVGLLGGALDRSACDRLWPPWRSSSR